MLRWVTQPSLIELPEQGLSASSQVRSQHQTLLAGQLYTKKENEWPHAAARTAFIPGPLSFFLSFLHQLLTAIFYSSEMQKNKCSDLMNSQVWPVVSSSQLVHLGPYSRFTLSEILSNYLRSKHLSDMHCLWGALLSASEVLLDVYCYSRKLGFCNFMLLTKEREKL